MPVGTIWEPQRERVKIDLRLPRDLHKQVQDICVLLGIPKNAFFAMGAAILITELSSLRDEEKSDGARRIASSILQKVLKTLRS